MKWSVYGHVVGSKYIGEVEADTAEQAKELGLAHRDCSVCLCHQCSGECDNAEIEFVTVEKADGL